MLARASRHPLSRAISDAAGAGPVAAGVREMAGDGLEATVGDVRVRLGRASWVGLDESTPVTAASHLWLRRGTVPAVRFDFEDALRDDARGTVGQLQARGFTVEMLSGDRNAPAAAVAAAGGISTWHAARDPKQKTEHLESLRAQGRRTLMVGDGLNDAAALSLAHVSISPGTAAQASQAASDMVLQGDALSPIVEAVDVARGARRLVFQNFMFAAVYNAAAVPLAALGQVTPLIAAIAMSASSLIVMLNALRLAGRR
jgi:Cu2+-exporting ATPase